MNRHDYASGRPKLKVKTFYGWYPGHQFYRAERGIVKKPFIWRYKNLEYSYEDGTRGIVSGSK